MGPGFQNEQRGIMHRIDFQAGNIVVFTWAGEFTLNEYYETMAELEASKAYHPDIDTIWDLREADTQHLSIEDVRSIAANSRKLASQRKKDWKVAIVANTDLTFGLARMYEAYANGINNRTKVFRDFEQAEAWVREPD